MDYTEYIKDMTHNMTEMVVTERNTYSETEPVRCHTVDKEMCLTLNPVDTKFNVK